MTQAGGNPPIRASEALLKKLAKIGLHSEADLLVHLPLRYEDETRITPVERAFGGEPVQVEVVVHSNELQFRPRRQMVVRAGDGTGDITLRFFSFYPSQQAALSVGSRIRAFGEVRGGFFGAEMVHPRFRKVGDDDPLPTEMTPIYPTTAGLANSALQKLIGKALATGDLSETLPDELRQRLKLPALARSLKFLHTPPPGTDLDTLHARNHPAWRRVKFDEVLAQQLSLRRAYLARREQGAPVLVARDDLGARLLDGLQRALGSHPDVVAIRGQGLMAGIELNRNCNELVGRALAEQHLLITVTRDNTIRLLPPLVCDEAQIDDIVARLAHLLSPTASDGPAAPVETTPQEAAA